MFKKKYSTPFYWLGLTFLFFQGCAGLSRQEYSIPTLSEPVKISRFEDGIGGGVFQFKEMSLHVYPGNVRRNDLLLFPLPVYLGEYGLEPPFLISIAIKPKKSGAMLDLQKIYFWKEVSDKYSPTRIMGPYSCPSSVAYPEKRNLPVDPISLQTNKFTCMWLEFDVAPPDPKENFYLEILGLSFGKDSYKIPTIFFKPSKKVNSFAVP